MRELSYSAYTSLNNTTDLVRLNTNWIGLVIIFTAKHFFIISWNVIITFAVISFLLLRASFQTGANDNSSELMGKNENNFAEPCDRDYYGNSKHETQTWKLEKTWSKRKCRKTRRVKELRRIFQEWEWRQTILRRTARTNGWMGATLSWSAFRWQWTVMQSSATPSSLSLSPGPSSSTSSSPPNTTMPSSPRVPT